MLRDHHVPLVVIASQSAALAEGVANQLRREGNVVYVTHSAEGCLRVATSVAPDVVLIDPALKTRRLEQLLKAHPTSARAEILHLSDGSQRPAFPLGRPATTAGPHAA